MFISVSLHDVHCKRFAPSATAIWSLVQGAKSTVWWTASLQKWFCWVTEVFDPNPGSLRPRARCKVPNPWSLTGLASACTYTHQSSIWE